MSTWFELRRNPEVTYSSWSAEGRTSVTVTWKSSTGVADFTQSSTVAGPTIVVALVNGVVWNAIPSGAGTVVQSQSGVADQALPAGGRLVSGRTAGVEGQTWRLPDGLSEPSVLRDPQAPK